MKLEKPLKMVDKGRNIPPNHLPLLVDNRGRGLAEVAKIEVICHSKLWNDFFVSIFPPDLEPSLIPVILRRAADKTEMDLMQTRMQSVDVEPGEIVDLGGLKAVTVGTVPGHMTPTFVVDWTAPNMYDVPLQAASAGPNKNAMWCGLIERNRKHICRGVKELYGTKKDKKLIIAGSGPSLQVDRLLKLISDRNEGKEYAKQWEIMACNDAYRLLNGKPEYFFLIESQAKETWWSKIGTKTKALFSISVHPAAVEQKWTGVYWHAAWPPKPGVPQNQEYIEKVGALHEQLNVTMSALHMAYLMGYQTIVLVGCDFAYTHGCAHKDEPAVWRDFVYSYQEGVNGGVVLTDSILALQARCHEAAAYWLTKAGIKVYNCSDGIMTGMECRDLETVLGEA